MDDHTQHLLIRRCGQIPSTRGEKSYYVKNSFRQRKLSSDAACVVRIYKDDENKVGSIIKKINNPNTLTSI